MLLHLTCCTIDCNILKQNNFEKANKKTSDEVCYLSLLEAGISIHYSINPS